MSPPGNPWNQSGGINRPNTYKKGAPTNYVAGLGRGAIGFTTRSDIGPARSKESGPGGMRGDPTGGPDNGPRKSGMKPTDPLELHRVRLAQRTLESLGVMNAHGK